MKRRIVLVSYVEPLNEARTPLVDFFRILLGLLRGAALGEMLVPRESGMRYGIG